MIDLAAAMISAEAKWLTGSTGITTDLLLLMLATFCVIVFLHSDGARMLSGLLCFVISNDILAHASTQAAFSFRISREFVVLTAVLPAGASITIACGDASRAALAAIFGEGEYAS